MSGRMMGIKNVEEKEGEVERWRRGSCKKKEWKVSKKENREEGCNEEKQDRKQERR